MLPGSSKEIVELLIKKYQCKVADIAARSCVTAKTIYRILKGGIPSAKTHSQLIQLYLTIELNPQEQLAMNANKLTPPRNKLKKYYLGTKFPDVSFTQRESDCMMYFLQGKSIVETAKIIKLSARTVEFYLGNMKLKMACYSKNQLVAKVLESDFIRNYSEIEKI